MHNLFYSAAYVISQIHNYVQELVVKTSDRPLDSETWQTECQTAPLAKVQWCEYKNQTLEVFLWPTFDCPVAHQKFSLLATAHYCKIGFYCNTVNIHFHS